MSSNISLSRKLVNCLNEYDFKVADLTDALNVSSAAISKALGILRETEYLFVSTRFKRICIYARDNKPKAFIAIYNFVLDHHEQLEEYGCLEIIEKLVEPNIEIIENSKLRFNLIKFSNYLKNEYFNCEQEEKRDNIFKLIQFIQVLTRSD